MDIKASVDKASGPQYPFLSAGKPYWLQSLQDRNGRVAVLSGSGNPDPEPISLADFDIRTRVNEYGGKCFCVVGNRIIFNNFSDGILYSQELKAGAVPAVFARQTAKEPIGFADLAASGSGNWVFAVTESRQPEAQPSCAIVAIPYDPETPDRDRSNEMVTLASGADFYARPVLSPDGLSLAWLEWSHPDMPWDRTRLVVLRLRYEKGTICLHDAVAVVDSPDTAVSQPGFLPDGSLVFASDSATCDYWNLFRYRGDKLKQITHEQAEFGEAHWAFGQNRWIVCGSSRIIAIATQPDSDRIVEVDVETGQCRDLSARFAACSHLETDGSGGVLLVVNPQDSPAHVLHISLSTKASAFDACSKGPGMKVHSKPELLEFPTGDNDRAYGYFYPPCNPEYEGPEGSSPPLVVMIHGGPTGRATRAYAGIKQYFCSLGFAVLDVNHRGSTGFGRRYRQSLLGNWGEYDCEDIRSGILHVVEKGLVDPRYVFIRGSSAGGYAVLRALSRYPSLFCAGASYYGIGNLITLSEITHRFESRYTDQLIGEEFDPERSRRPDSLYVQRSPVFDLDKVECPLILFQGDQDKVVPPRLAQEVVDLLKAKGIHHAYHEYRNEGHGFRRTENRIDALHRETSFFSGLIHDPKCREPIDSTRLSEC